MDSTSSATRRSAVTAAAAVAARVRLRPLPLLLVVGAAGGFVAAFTARVADWGVMTDELLYAKLATAVGDTLSPLPTIHGERIAVLDQLYPLLLSPLFAAFDAPTAFHAAHVLNAFAMASAAIPAYLLARDVLPRGWAYAVALAAVLVPWMLLAGFLMTEVAAYPVFLWVVLAFRRAIVSPGRLADAVAAAAVVPAFLVRTQFVVLAAVLPVAILLHEVGRAGGPPRRRLTAGPRAALERHRTLAAIYAAAGVAAAVAAAVGALGRAFGVYEAAVQGSLLPAATWRAAAVHLDVLAVGMGVVPFLLGGAWALAAAFRARDDRARALALLTVLTTVVLVVEGASFDVRFGASGIVRDRYLFYVVPLLLAGAVAAALDRRGRWLALPALAALVAATAHWHDFPVVPGLAVDSPASVVNAPIAEESGALSPATFVAVAAALLGVALLAALPTIGGRALAAAVVVFSLGFNVAATAYGFDRLLGSRGPSGRSMEGSPAATRDWIDGAVPAGAEIGILPFPVADAWGESALRWWDTEFWNRTVRRAYVGGDGTFSYTPFPVRTLAPSFATGRVPPLGDEPDYLVVAAADSRFGLAGVRHGASYELEIVLPEHPYRAAWATRGLDVDGWTRPRRPVTIRAFADRQEPRLVTLDVTLYAPRTAYGPVSYSLGAGRDRRTGRLDPGATATERVELCLPRTGHADATLVAGVGAVVDAPPLQPKPKPRARVVGVRVGPVELAETGRSCSSP